MRRERMENNGITTLSAGITAVVTTVTVADGSVFPATGDYRVIVGTEIMLVTARSTNDLTVVRGVEGTTAAAQSSGDAIRMILTAGALNQWRDDITGGASDSYPHKFIAEGDTLTSSDFTWVNQSTASAIDNPAGPIMMKAPIAAPFSFRILKIAAPAAPWTLSAFIKLGPGLKLGSTGSVIGICAREASSGKLLIPNIRSEQVVSTFKFTDETTYAGSNLGTNQVSHSNEAWFRMEDDNTDIIISTSSDGINWMELGREARGTFPTATGYFDEVGICCDSSSAASADGQFHFISWVLE